MYTIYTGITDREFHESLIQACSKIINVCIVVRTNVLTNVKDISSLWVFISKEDIISFVIEIAEQKQAGRLKVQPRSIVSKSRISSSISDVFEW